MSESKPTSGLAVLGGLLAVGLIAAALILGLQFKNFRQPGTITVKGLAEKEYQSDQAQWSTSVGVHADSYQAVLDAIQSQQPRLHRFLREQGFEDSEIQIGAPDIQRAYTTEYDENRNERRVPNGYDGSLQLLVRTNKLDRIQAAHQDIINLRAQNEFIDFSAPQYLINDLETIKRELINQATADARQRAEEFAKTGDAKVGNMRAASQGSFNIYADNGSSEEEEYGGTYDKSTVVKQVRLVVTIEYNID